jgi:hypothetical protein
LVELSNNIYIKSLKDLFISYTKLAFDYLINDAATHLTMCVDLKLTVAFLYTQMLEHLLLPIRTKGRVIFVLFCFMCVLLLNNLFKILKTKKKKKTQNKFE